MGKKNLQKVIIAVIALLLIIGAVVVWSIAASNQTDTDSSDSTAVDPAKEFAPINPDTVAHETTSSTTSSGMTITTTTRNDGKGTSVSSTVVNGESTDTYVTDNAIITCINDICRKSSASTEDIQSQPSLNPDQFQATAKHSGTESCGSGNCEVWTVETDNGDIVYYVDDQNRINKVTAGGASITYSYKDVVITVPEV